MVALQCAYVCISRATRVAVDHVRGCASIVVPPGAYQDTVAWPSRRLFVAAVDIAVRGPWRAQLRRTPKDATTPDTFMRWLRREADGADSATGRGQRESVDRIAAELGYSTALVQRCRRIARDLGLYRDVVGGRLLRLDERLDVHALGSRQRGVTGERAFTVPATLRPILAALSPPSPRRSTSSVTHARHGFGPNGVGKSTTFRMLHRSSSTTSPAVSSATQPGQGHSNGKPPGKHVDLVRRTRRKAAASGGHSSYERALAPGEELARAVADRLPYQHRLQPRRVAAHFAPFEAAGWTASALLAAGDAVMRALGWRSPSSAGNGYLAWLLRHIDPSTYDAPPHRPAWCGCCDERTRLVELDDARMQRCPACHPLAVDA
ncbi:hypothetical protein E1262_27115 [Jiangella aurantiaca]|uniref:Uncharacterized protein n=1 Tax=Jiangella aurantiaca TaxID=2530373 RepID=A0A4R5A284_9ACTN|nr:hypothetical protein [Jiangella aurantiaca]TDD64764.1 hypothetical protein E1262_27115 [Jiangella aurantiaca]